MQKKVTREQKKEKSKQKFLDAVGSILEDKGHAGLKVNDIAKKAGLDKKLIYKYFGSTNGLLDEYIRSKDFWSNVKISDAASEPTIDNGKAFATELLQNQFDYVSQDKEFQKVLLWSLSEERKSLKKMTQDQEENGELMFGAITDPHFGEKAEDFRAVMALLISGTYYLSLYAEANGSTFCGLDLKNATDNSKIKDALKFLINSAYKNL